MGEAEGRIRGCESGRLSESVDEQAVEELPASGPRFAGTGDGREVQFCVFLEVAG